VKLTTHLRLVPRSKNGWSCTFTPQYAFMAWCSVKGSTGTTLPLFTFYLNKSVIRINLLGNYMHYIHSKEIQIDDPSFTKGSLWRKYGCFFAWIKPGSRWSFWLII
jgi:hypothetical protein